MIVFCSAIGSRQKANHGGCTRTLGEVQGGEEVGGLSDLRAEHSSLAQMPFQKLQRPIPPVSQPPHCREARRTRGVESGCAVPPTQAV